MLNPRNTDWAMLPAQGGAITIDAPGTAALADVQFLLAVRDYTVPDAAATVLLTVEEVHDLIRRLHAWETEYHRVREGR